MRRSKDMMLRSSDERCLLLSVGAPENEDDAFELGIDNADDSIGKLLPALALMRVRVLCLHGEYGIEKEHALPGPPNQVTVLRLLPGLA